ncbi:MAG: hypothetical protein PHI36_04925 [Bacteroidales bacterium]|nr:hypothetical protein [Bacteroidales bacterium]
MKTTIKSSLFLVVLAFLTACGGSKVKYETYHNQFYNFTVEYPDFLIPQGEAANQDGQKFISEDQTIQLFVYRDYKNDYLSGGDLYTVSEAYNEELKLIEGVFNKKIEDKHYIIEYKTENVLHYDYALLSGDNYFNIRFEYPENEKDRMKSTVENVIKSFKVEALDANADEPASNASAGGSEDPFLVFLEGFLKDCYWGKNINNLLRKKDKNLANYIDSKMDVRRYYAPGTIARLGTRDEDFGFSQEDDFTTRPRATGDLIFEYINDHDNSTPCELIYSNINVIYYTAINSVPNVVVSNETFETKPVKIAYPEAQLMAVYLPNAYGNPRGFYFINTPNGWKLAFVDDSLCEA